MITVIAIVAVVKWIVQKEQADLLMVVSLIVTWCLVVVVSSYKSQHCTFHGSLSSEVVRSSNHAVVCEPLLAY